MVLIQLAHVAQLMNFVDIILIYITYTNTCLTICTHEKLSWLKGPSKKHAGPIELKMAHWTLIKRVHGPINTSHLSSHWKCNEKSENGFVKLFNSYIPRRHVVWTKWLALQKLHWTGVEVCFKVLHELNESLYFDCVLSKKLWQKWYMYVVNQLC